MITTMSSFDDHSCQGRGEKPRTRHTRTQTLQSAHARELLISNLAHAYLALYYKNLPRTLNSVLLCGLLLLYSIILDRGHGIYQAAKSLHVIVDIDSCLCGSSRCLQWCL